jgi:hypothetical protein
MSPCGWTNTKLDQCHILSAECGPGARLRGRGDDLQLGCKTAHGRSKPMGIVDPLLSFLWGLDLKGDVWIDESLGSYYEW